VEGIWSQCCQILAFKHEITQEAEKPQRKTSEQRRRTTVHARQHDRMSTTTVHAHHHEQTVVVSVFGLLCSASLLRHLLFLTRGTCYAMPMLSHFRPP